MELTKEKESQNQRDSQRKIVRIPLAGQPEDFSFAGAPEQRFINVMPETVKNTATGVKKLHVVQRPSIYPYDNFPSHTEGRGVWYLGNLLIYVFDSTAYIYNTSDISLSTITLKTTTGMCGCTEVYNNQYFLCDGIDGYIVYSDGTYKNVEESYLRWSANTIVENGDKRIPSSYTYATTNRYYYTASVTSGDSTGETGGSAPTWPTTIGQTVTDGDITWTCTAKQNDMAVKWTSGAAYAVGDFVQPVTETSLYYIVTVSDGSAGASEPTWPLAIGESVTLDGVTYECVGYYGGFPSPHTPTPVFMDGYIFLPEEDSIDIYNSGVFNNFSWNPLDFISAENFPDKVIALARQANFVVAFGSNSTELFYNAANEEGSPLLRNENYLLQVGLATRTAIFQAEKYLMWIAKTPAGKYSVWSLNGYEAREVSTETIERLLASDYTNFIGFGVRILGHILFVINCYDNDDICDRTVVYDLEEELWHEWSYNDIGCPIAAITSASETGDQTIYGISYKDENGGNLYTLNSTLYTDGIYDDSLVDLPITIEIYLQPQDFDNSRLKFYHRAELVCDPLYTGTFTLSWKNSDFSYTNRDLTENGTTRKFITQCGSDRRRFWKLTVVLTGISRFRAEALEVVYTQGRT